MSLSLDLVTWQLLETSRVSEDMDEARMKEMFQKFGNVVSVKLAREAKGEHLLMIVQYRPGCILKKHVTLYFMAILGELLF